jgi:hypothetical protein
MKNQNNKGFAVVTVLIMLVVFSVMLASYFALTRIQLATTTAKTDKVTGFYAAEGALNVRGETIKQTFVGFNRPSGTSPSDANQTCTGTNVGSGSFACITHTDIPTNNRTVQSYVVEEPSNPIIIQSLPNGRFQGLSAQEFRYDVFSEAFNATSGLPEARLQMRFRSRLVPLFQFAAFYENDLEVFPGPNMTLSGRVHTNSNLYLGSGASLTIDGKVSAVGRIFGGRKYFNADGTRDCFDNSKTVRLPSQISSADNRTVTQRLNLTCQNAGYTDQQLAVFNTNSQENVKQNVKKLEIPKPEILDPDPTNQQSNEYWEKSDLRVVLKLNASGVPITTLANPLGIEVQNSDGTLNAVATSRILSASCIGALGTSNTFKNQRENKQMRMLDVDMTKLLACVGTDNSLVQGGLADSTEGGLVVHFSVDGPNSAGINNYGVRVRNGKTLDSRIKGLTVVTNQAMYVQGDYNSPDPISGKKPASFLADSLNILSNSWSDTNSSLAKSARIATDTKINAAFLAGVDKTQEGNLGTTAYNGGLENYPRFHESWSNKTLALRGSFVSLGVPKHVNGKWSNQSYDAPLRDWNYDLDFNDAGKLPPLSPRFVELVQEIFTRDFTRQY